MTTALTFEDRVVVITGAGNGIGRSYAQEFAKRGAKVVVNDLGGSIGGRGSDKNSADKVVEQIVAANGHAVANYDSVVDGGKIIDCAMDTWGRVDVLLNNAGIAYPTAFSDMSEKRWKFMLDVHLDGSYRCSQAAWGHMQKQKFGRVLFTTSPWGLYGFPSYSHYATAKAAMIGLMKSLALEGKVDNIHCNAVAPFASSRMTGSDNQEQDSSPVGPRFLAQFAVWLSHQSCTETGSVFELGGGYIHKARWQLSNALHLPEADHTAENIAANKSTLDNFDPGFTPGLGDYSTVGKEVFGDDFEAMTEV